MLRQDTSSSLEAEQAAKFPRRGIISFLVIIGLLLVLFSGLLIHNLPLVMNPLDQNARAAQPSALASQVAEPLLLPGKNKAPTLQLPARTYNVYEQSNHVYLALAGQSGAQRIATPGYLYSQSVVPILTPSGQLFYSGDGVWETNIFTGQPKQVALLPAGQVITSMALSKDGKTLAWSTEPKNGNGMTSLYAGQLGSSTLVYQHSASDCPCFRIFSFLDAAEQQADKTDTTDSTLLLTDDRGDHHRVMYGLWTFHLTEPTTAPQPLIEEDAQQGPLALAPTGNTVLYSTHEGVVPAPTDGSIPDDVAGLNYANSLLLAPIEKHAEALGPSHVVLPEQTHLSNASEYHWVTTPVFSPDGQTLVYIVFSSDADNSFQRHSALYQVHLTYSGTQRSVGKPQLLATSTALFAELGTWLDPHILTFYADKTMYALDVSTGAVATLAQTDTYARMVGIVHKG